MWLALGLNPCTVLNLHFWSNNILLATKGRNVVILVLLDSTAASDRVDYGVPLSRLEHWVGVKGAVMKGFCFYLAERFCVLYSTSPLWGTIGFQPRTPFYSHSISFPWALFLGNSIFPIAMLMTVRCMCPWPPTMLYLSNVFLTVLMSQGRWLWFFKGLIAKLRSYCLALAALLPASLLTLVPWHLTKNQRSLILVW